jgi:hypothetical protein
LKPENTAKNHSLHHKSSERRRSQVVRQRSAKPLFIGSIPIAASNSPHPVFTKSLAAAAHNPFNWKVHNSIRKAL